MGEAPEGVGADRKVEVGHLAQAQKNVRWCPRHRHDDGAGPAPASQLGNQVFHPHRRRVCQHQRPPRQLGERGQAQNGGAEISLVQQVLIGS